jgi:ABC-type multidrug transport system ATPase subunit/ABC-type multidrug transport system permease subunit
VSVTVAGRRLLTPTSISVARGELVGLIGPSGSGKSTLLRVLGGVMEPSQGDVRLGGDPVAMRSREVGFLPEGDVLHEQLTASEALRFTGALRLPHGTSPEDIEARVTAVLEELRLTARADTRISDLSAGERGRVACASELIGDPMMLLLDEPAAGLDPGLERQLMVILRRLADEGRGVLVVTHATSSLALCDTIAVLGHGGRLRAYGPPAEILEQFGVQAYDEIYLALGELGDEPVEEHEHHERPPRPRGRGMVDQPFALQTVLLAARYARCLRRDHKLLLLLIGQAPIIGLFIGLVLPSNVLNSSELAPLYGVFLGFMLLISSTWLGLAASCREIARERTIVEREAAAGVRLDAYLVAKVLVLFPVGIVQVVLLFVVTVILQPLGTSANGYLEVLGLCIAASWASMAMGLAVSARVRREGQASSAVPLLLIPQLLLGGAIIPTAVMPGFIKGVSVLAFSRWGMAGIGSAMQVGQRLSDDVTSVTGYSTSFFSLSPAVSAGALAMFILVGLMLAARALDRRADL